MKTNELIGTALDWAVAKSEGYSPSTYGGIVRTTMAGEFGPEYCPSTNWAQGGPIIEREGIYLNCMRLERHGTYTLWEAWAYRDTSTFSEASEPLVAAMRCYVASKLGDEVEIPEELLPIRECNSLEQEVDQLKEEVNRLRTGWLTLQTQIAELIPPIEGERANDPIIDRVRRVAERFNFEIGEPLHNEDDL